MSVSNIASSNPYLSLLQASNKPKQDLSSLATALDSGDLTGAQGAFAAVQQDLMQTGTTSTIGSDLQQIQGALNSNDLTDAKTAFSTLLQDIQQLTSRSPLHPHHHHHAYTSQNRTPLNLGNGLNVTA